MGATLIAWVEAGKFSIVAIGLLVAKSVPEFQVGGGSPAKDISSVFDPWKEYENSRSCVNFE